MRILLPVIRDRSRRSSTQLELVAHFLETCSESFNLQQTRASVRRTKLCRGDDRPIDFPKRKVVIFLPFFLLVPFGYRAED